MYQQDLANLVNLTKFICINFLLSFDISIRRVEEAKHPLIVN